MKTTYDLGADTNQITFRVTVGSLATAYSSVYLTKMGGQQTQIAESGHETGHIGQTKPGIACDLRNHYLVVLTNLNLKKLDSSLWEQQVEQLEIVYEISGGSAGTQTFVQDADDMKVMPDGKILVTKPIELL